MIIKVYNENPNEKAISQIVETLRSDGVIIYPTDSVYAFGCSIKSPKAIERIKALKGKQTKEFSIVCEDLRRVAEYARVDNDAFMILKRNLPGPFTFVLRASSTVPDKTLQRRKTIGVRIPSNAIARAIVSALGSPMITSSVREVGEQFEYTTDPELIHERYAEKVDLVVDGGIGDIIPTTLIDMSNGEVEILREGREELSF